MPRVERHFLPGYAWHLPHGCRQKTFRLMFARYRRRYLREESAAYACDFATESDALRLANTVRWEKNLEIAES